MESKWPLYIKEMKGEYTVLIPTMLPMHFKMIASILNAYGHKAELLENTGPQIREIGLKYVHNDTCYPALLVIGQMIDALNSGKYDSHKVALLISQTGGGCRASNYLFLLRKALANAGYDYVPVISFSLVGLEKSPGFSLTLPVLHRMLYAVLYGDLLMTLVNQTRPYELNKGDAQNLADKWIKILTDEMAGSLVIRYGKIRRHYKAIVEEFAAIPKSDEEIVKVGIVGEIFMKFSPLGNNHLEDFLVEEGAEPVLAGLLDFCLYCVYNGIIDWELYKKRRWKKIACNVGMRFLIRKQKDVIRVIKKNGCFRAPTPFDRTCKICDGVIGHGVKMGEGWLLTSEMLELIEQGVSNVVCAQPFGCLPNHIVGKGMMKKMRQLHPEANIAAIDYDSSASAINQENRIKLLLANANKKNTQSE